MGPNRAWRGECPNDVPVSRRTTDALHRNALMDLPFLAGVIDNGFVDLTHGEALLPEPRAWQNAESRLV
jgi:hypothetical protein